MYSTGVGVHRLYRAALQRADQVVPDVPTTNEDCTPLSAKQSPRGAAVRRRELACDAPGNPVVKPMANSAGWSDELEVHLGLAARRPDGNGTRVLLADGNLAILAALSDTLTSYGYLVAVARNGREALRQAQAFSPNLILLDVQLPDLDGFAVMRQLRSAPTPSTAPIIVLTALTNPGDRERCLEAGASAYLIKPASLAALLYIIETLGPPNPELLSPGACQDLFQPAVSAAPIGPVGVKNESGPTRPASIQRSI